MATTSTNQSVISELEDYIRRHGGPYPAWYAGVAADPRARLFQDHGVREHGDAWAYRDCGTDSAARAVEDYFLRKGCKGGDGGGSRQTRYAYVYKIARHTNP